MSVILNEHDARCKMYLLGKGDKVPQMGLSKPQLLLRGRQALWAFALHVSGIIPDIMCSDV